jgi:hypothetical protein
MWATVWLKKRFRRRVGWSTDGEAQGFAAALRRELS